MGMAASQARLLSLTSQMHNVEFKAQGIEAQKIALATQKDELYQKYCEALDATVITVAYDGANAEAVYVNANFSTLCGYSKDRFQDYALKNNRSGNVIVTDAEKEAWDATYGRDKYAFAWYAIGLDNNFGVGDDGYAQIGIGTYTGTSNLELTNGNYSAAQDHDCYMTAAEWQAFDYIINTTPVGTKDLVDNLKEKYENISDAENVKDKMTALSEFRDYFYSNFMSTIMYSMQVDNQDTDQGNSVKFSDQEWEDSLKGQFDYYCRLFDEIKSAGGCETIEPEYQSGDNGTEWFGNMVKSGLITIRTFDKTKNTWSDTSIATSVSANYLREEQDERGVKKAEAEYEHQLSVIKSKDTKFDNELSKLETERSSIKTEMDAIKTIISDNSEKTFGIFS